MELLSIEIIQINKKKIDEIDNIIKSIYRLIIYSRHHLDDDLLDIYLEGVNNLKELLSIKNAQMEAQNEEEAKEYLQNLKVSLDFFIEEIIITLVKYKLEESYIIYSYNDLNLDNNNTDIDYNIFSKNDKNICGNYKLYNSILEIKWNYNKY